MFFYRNYFLNLREVSVLFSDECRILEANCNYFQVDPKVSQITLDSCIYTQTQKHFSERVISIQACLCFTSHAKPVSSPWAKTTSRRGDDITKWHNTHTHSYWMCRHVWSSDHNTDFLLSFSLRKKTELIHTGQLAALPTDREGCMWHIVGVAPRAILRVYITHPNPIYGRKGQ